MERNGKGVSIDGQRLPYEAGEIVFWGASCGAILRPAAVVLCRSRTDIQILERLQVSMESIKKDDGIDSQRLPYKAGEINFGEPVNTQMPAALTADALIELTTAILRR